MILVIGSICFVMGFFMFAYAIIDLYFIIPDCSQ